MDKASTPPNRLTRSSAKQVNVSSKTVEENLENQSGGDVKHSVRKSRRKIETKPKTNGDTSTNVDSKTFKNNEENSDSNSVDGCGSEDSNTSTQMRNSPMTNNKSSPTISRKSLRTRRSVTPGPELEYSASKKMRRSTSEGKLESVSTPKSRRNIRAKSESKDFVFTPTKNNDKVNSLAESNSKHIHRNSMLRVIEESAEASEIENCSQDELKNPQISEVINDQTEISEGSQEINLDGGRNVDNSSASRIEQPEVINNTDKTDVKDNDNNQSDVEVKDTSQSLNRLSVSLEGDSDNISQETSDQLHISKADKSSVEKKTNYSDIKEIVNADEEDSDVIQITSDSENVTQSFTLHTYKSASPQPLILVEENEENKIDKTNLKSDDSIEIDITAEESESQEVPKSIHSNSFQDVNPDGSANLKVSEGSSPVVNLENMSVAENNNLTITDVQNENESLPNKDHLTTQGDTSDSKYENSSAPKLDDNNVCIEENKFITQPLQVDTNVKCNDESVFVCETDMKQTKCNETEESSANDASILSSTKDIIINKEYYESEGEGVENNAKEVDENKMEDDFELNSDECELSVEVLSKSNGNNDAMQNHLTHLNSRIEETEPYNIHIENTCTVVEDDSPVNMQFLSTENVEITQDPLEEEFSESAVLIEEEPNRIEILNEYAADDDFSEKKEDSTVVKLCEQKKIIGHEPTNKINKSEEVRSEEVFEEDNYDDEGSNKIEEDSGSDSDIYKGLSDFGTDGEERKDESQFDENVTSESGTGASEDYVSSGDGEEEHEECTDKVDIPSKDPKDRLNELKMSKENTIKTGEKIFETNSPMTYDKALAILNKNRVKKIDDEEFFDMFTQELNRVSEESGSDSDIAIVDEYIMEPEEPAKKPNPKASNSQTNPKPPQKPHPPQSNEPMQQPPEHSEHYTCVYNQQVDPQHNHPMIPKMSFTQGSLYHQYNQNMQGMQPVNSIRGSIMYNQYAPPPTSMPDPRMYNPHIPPNVNFGRAGMFSHHLNPEAQLQYQNPPLKVRCINSLNNSQTSKPMNPNYNPSDQVSAVGLSSQRDSHENESDFSQSVRVSAATMTETNDKLDQATTYSSPTRENDENTTSILKILGLDKKRLNMLKEVLGLKKKSKKSQQKSKCTKKTPSQAKRTKSRFRAEGDKKRKSMLLKEILESDSKFSQYATERSSSEIFSEETASSYSGSNIDVLRKAGDKSSSDDALENENRQINIEGNAMSVTFRTHSETSPRREIWEHFKTHTSNSSDSSQEFIPLRKKRKRAHHLREKSSPQNVKTQQRVKMDVKRFKFETTHSLSSDKKSSQKMVQARKQTKQEPKVLKSNAGTFTVDSVAQIQSSESEVFEDENQDSEPSDTRQELPRKARIEMASGKNKLSNLFSQRSLKENTKRSKNIEPSQHSRKRQERSLKKLPQELLEELASKEQKDRKPQLIDSVSEDSDVEKPRKKRKRSTKVNIKSVAAEQDYIPCVTSGATQFGLSRLDKDSLLSSAEKAAKFRTDRLYGSSVKRITILDFKG